MTNYNKWDAKASALVKEADEEEKQETEESNKALGLEDGPMGPARAKAKEELSSMEEHSKSRKDFIEWCQSREVTLTHAADSESLISLGGEELNGKAVRLSGSEGVTYLVPADASLIKLMVDKCRGVRIQVLGNLLTSSAELCRCEDLDLELSTPLGTLQVDECTAATRVRFAERDHVGRIYHQNSPGLAVGWGSGGEELHSIGRAVAAQFITALAPGSAREPLETQPVVRGEGEYPLDLLAAGGASAQLPASGQPEPELPPAPEERARRADEARQKGNEMFRANDFMQAALQYTQAIELNPAIAAVYSNRAQCFLKLGQHEKALADAEKCVEVDPSNAKGWFRKGISLHALKRYPEAIPALAEAEKLEPTNKQVTDAIKMAQLMARKQAASAA